MACPAASPSALPAFVFREVVSWSADSASARALLNACRATHTLRSDPVAAALLLTRCRISDHCSYRSALESCGRACEGGTQVVSQQVLRLLTASADSGGPYPVPAQLLQAMLFSAALSGARLSVLALLALPAPPDVNLALRAVFDHRPTRAEDFYKGSPARGLEEGLVADRHLAAMHMLLQSGADPFAGDLLRVCARQPRHRLALGILFRHCPPGIEMQALVDAFRAEETDDRVLEVVSEMFAILGLGYEDAEP